MWIVVWIVDIGDVFDLMDVVLVLMGRVGVCWNW